MRRKYEGKDPEPPLTEEEKKRRAVYDFIKSDEEVFRVKSRSGKEHSWVRGKPYPIREVWLNNSKYNSMNHYMTIQDGDKRYHVSVDYKTANGNTWAKDQAFNETGRKVSANGWIYLDEKGYPRYRIKDLREFELHRRALTYDPSVLY